MKPPGSLSQLLGVVARPLGSCLMVPNLRAAFSPRLERNEDAATSTSMPGAQNPVQYSG